MEIFLREFIDIPINETVAHTWHTLESAGDDNRLL